MGTAQAIGGIIRVDRMKNSRSSASGTRKRENPYAASTARKVAGMANGPRNHEDLYRPSPPSKFARMAEPKPMISEFKKRSTNRDGPAITMSRSRAIFSYHVLGAGSLAMKSGD